MAVAAVLLEVAVASAQQPKAMDAAQVRLALHRLSTVGSALYIGAHPDDENTAMLAYLAQERHLRTAYLSLTRGDGGQNLIGSEQDEALGVIRTEELLQARAVDGAEQFFTRAVDFGYSKSPDETLKLWGKEEILADVVWVIRSFQPDVIITRFPADGGGGHGHHTASAILAREAFAAAADPTRFAEQLRTVRPWQAKRILWNAWRPQLEGRSPDMPPLLTVDLGTYSPLLGVSYSEVAARARTMHKSQGFGSAERRGSLPNYLELMAGEAAEADLLDRIDTTWKRVPGSGGLVAALQRAERALDPERPDAILPELIEVLTLMEALPPEPLVTTKRQEAMELVSACLGLYIAVDGPALAATAGSQLPVTVTVLSRTDAPVVLERVELSGGATIADPVALVSNKPFVRETVLALPAQLPLGGPHWLREPRDGFRYTVDNPALRISPHAPPELTARVTLRVLGRPVSYSVPVTYRSTDPVHGERVRGVAVVPPVTLTPERSVALFADASPRRISVSVEATTGPVGASVRLVASAGWRADPPSHAVNLSGKGARTSLAFTVTPPAAADEGTLEAVAAVEGREYNRALVAIDHLHIPVQTLLPPARVKVVRADVRSPGGAAGYLMGAGDGVVEGLRELGYTVTLLDDETLRDGDLSGFAAIVCGVRAFNTRQSLAVEVDRLMEYVRRGGTLVVQYNTNREMVTDRLGPYPIEISRDRVTVETAPVTFALPGHPLLSAPNLITQSDFTGWVQERGLNFPGKWDGRYEAPLAMGDPGEEATNGALLYARFGDGVFIYTGLSFFRQLPAGVAGAYRLFANILAGGQPRE